MTLTGFEPVQQSSGNTDVSASGNALSDALLPDSALRTALDALAKLTPEQAEQLARLLAERRG